MQPYQTINLQRMPGPIAGMFFYLYLIVDIFSRKIVGWEVYGSESAEYASIVVRRAVWSESCLTSPLMLHADNGSPMKGATLKVTLEHFGVTASYSRPRLGRGAHSHRTCPIISATSSPNPIPTAGFKLISSPARSPTNLEEDVYGQAYSGT